MKRNLYLGGMLLGILVVISAVWFFMAFFQMGWLSERVFPVAGTRLPEWLDNFKLWATVGIVVSSVVTLLWYLLSVFYFKFNDWNKNYVVYWGLLLFAAVLPPAILGYLYTKETNVGSEWAYTFYIVNSFLIYYLATALFSPPSVKYTPSGAKYIRRW